MIFVCFAVTATRREDESHPREAGAVWAEAGTVLKVARDGRGAEAEDGGPYPGEGSGRQPQSYGVPLSPLPSH